MKIQEVTGLTGVKKFHDMMEFEFGEMMAQYGYEQINSGSHATVFHRPTDPFVYRIAKDDSPYESYAEYLLKSPPNPHYPKIYGIKNLPNFFKRRFSNRWSQFNIVKVEYIPYPVTAEEFNVFDRVYRGSNLKNGVLYSNADPEGKWRSLIEAIYRIYENVPNGSPDMHKANFGKRQDGTVVILDPLWEGETPYAAYDRMMKSETDYWGNDDDPVYIKGAWNKHREQQNNPPAKQYIPQPIEDDIPF